MNIPQYLSEEAVRALHRKNYELLGDLVTPDNINSTDSKGRSLIVYAINYSDLHMVEWLLDKCPNVDIQDKEGWTPLHYASQGYAVQMAEKLLGAGAKVDIQDGYGNTALWRAVFESRGRGELIKLLLRYRADSHVKNHSGVSPVELASTIANFDVKQYLG